MSEQLLCFDNKELIGYEVYICTQCFIFFYFIFFYHQIVAFHSIFNNNAFSIKAKYHDMYCENCMMHHSPLPLILSTLYDFVNAFIS